MIRNDKEYRRSKEQLSELEAELQKLSSVRRSAERDKVASAVIDALRMQIEDMEREIADVSVGVSLGMTTLFLAICLVTVWWIFKTGYRLKT